MSPSLRQTIINTLDGLISSSKDSFIFDKIKNLIFLLYSNEQEEIENNENEEENEINNEENKEEDNFNNINNEQNEEKENQINNE